MRWTILICLLTTACFKSTKVVLVNSENIARSKSSEQVYTMPLKVHLNSGGVVYFENGLRVITANGSKRLMGNGIQYNLTRESSEFVK